MQRKSEECVEAQNIFQGKEQLYTKVYTGFFGYGWSEAQQGRELWRQAPVSDRFRQQDRTPFSLRKNGLVGRGSCCLYEQDALLRKNTVLPPPELWTA